MISFIHRALQQSVERDKERTVNIMDLIVSDKQMWNFIIGWKMENKNGNGLGVSALYAVLYLLIEPPTASPLLGTGVQWVSLPGPTSVPSDTQARWYRGQSANPLAAALLLQLLRLRLTDTLPQSEKKRGKKGKTKGGKKGKEKKKENEKIKIKKKERKNEKMKKRKKKEKKKEENEKTKEKQ